MKLRRMGISGLQVSLVGLGCNNFGGRTPNVADSRAVVHKALDVGINLFDTADVYGDRGGSEEHLGQIMGARRKDIVLATKFSMAMDDAGMLKGGSRHYVMSAVEASLRRLKTDWIDLYQMHFPDPATPIEETLRALDDLVRQGKVRYIGCSNFAGWQLADACWTSKYHGLAGFISAQDEYSLLVRKVEGEVLPAARALGLGFLPYFPLASGLLSGKYRRDAPLPEGTRFVKTKALANRYLTDSNWAVVGKLEEFCAERGHSMLELAFSWLAAQPLVSSVIAGATSPQQVEQNARATDWALTAEDLAEIDKLTRQPVVGG